MQYLFSNFPYIAQLFWEQLRLTLIALGISLLIALPAGFLIRRVSWLQAPVLAALGAIYTLPSLSLLVLLIPIFGLGTVPAVIALVAYAQFMLVRSWLVGLTTIPEWVLEAADGMGMSRWQRFWKVEFPLALPMLLAGMRLATVNIIGIGTVAALINAGGLGTLLFEGVITANSQKIFAGGVAVSILALGANSLFGFLENRAARSTALELGR
jgi:osmoprotectant transport system permease protein